MKNVVVTGSKGFIGRNLVSRLRQLEDIHIIEYSKDETESLDSVISQADFVFHLAGVNRPQDETEFNIGNKDLTRDVLDALRRKGGKIPILLTSSTQAPLENAYGKSKLAAEELVDEYKKETGADIFIYRLPNVFGKWCKPNYNSAVATFCYNITRDLPIVVNDKKTKMTLAYVDDVVTDFISSFCGNNKAEKGFCSVSNSFETTLGEIVNTLNDLHSIRKTLVIPDLSLELTKKLYSTLISYYGEDNYSYDLTTNDDERGWLAEFIKSDSFGQVFISKTKPGFSRGNHWHHSKIEKFSVIDGEAEIAFRKVGQDQVFTYNVSGNKIQVIDVPVGYVHSVKNIGKHDMTLVIWANEILDKNNPDTYYEEV